MLFIISSHVDDKDSVHASIPSDFSKYCYKC